MYTLVKIDSGITKNLACRQKPIVWAFSGGCFGSCLVPGYRGYERGMLVDRMDCLVDLWVYHPGFRDLQLVEEVERLKKSTRCVLLMYHGWGGNALTVGLVFRTSLGLTRSTFS